MRKILIADASEQWRELLERAMGGEYLVRTSPDGPKTLQIAAQFEPDVLVMDLMLAGTDGLGRRQLRCIHHPQRCGQAGQHHHQ